MVARTYRGGMVLDVDAHFDRMERSATLLGRGGSVPRALIRSILDAERTAPGDIRFRVTAVLDEPVWFRVSIEEARDLPAALRTNGVVCGIARNAARENPTAKRTAWLHRRSGIFPWQRQGVRTSPDRCVRKYPRGSIFELLRDIRRRAPDRRYGCSRRHREKDHPVPRGGARSDRVRTGEPRRHRGGRIDEAWISSSTRGIVPVRRIASVDVRAAGPITTELIERWDRWMEEHLTPLVRPTTV